MGVIIARRFGCCVVVAILGLGGQTSCAQDEQVQAKQRRIQALIAQLVSPNQKPKLSAVFPSDYDRQAQVRVLNAWKGLIREGYDAFPLLINNLDDERYSCSVELNSGLDNLTVGEVCRLIVAYHVEAYQRDVWVSMMPYRYTLGQEDLKKWWSERKDRSLRDIQIESTEWALKVTHRASHPTISSKKLEAVLERLRSSTEPIGPEKLKGTLIGDRNVIGLSSDKKTMGAFGK